MKDFSRLTKKTLADMPVLLNTITTSVEQLQMVFFPIYEDLREILHKNLPSQFLLTDNLEQGTIYLFSDSYKRKYLENPSLFAEVHYRFNMEENLKNSSSKYGIEFGYICDEGDTYKAQNVIYFQVNNNSNRPFFNSGFLNKLRQNTWGHWNIGSYEDYSRIWLEFSADRSLSMEKIYSCAEDFKKYLLQPMLNKLNL